MIVLGQVVFRTNSCSLLRFCFSAAKFEEHDLNVPRQQELNIYVPPPGYTPVEYFQIELALLEFFSWNIGFPTAAHFISYFLCLAVESTDLHGVDPIQDISKAKVYMSKYSHYFLEITLQGKSINSN